MRKVKNDSTGLELAAMKTIYDALKSLKPDSRTRVMNYIVDRLNLNTSVPEIRQAPTIDGNVDSPEFNEAESAKVVAEEVTNELNGEVIDFEGVSAPGIKWIKRNKFAAKDLSTIFSLGGDEIDLVSNKISGKSRKERMKSVFLLKGIAQYLSTGTARFADKNIREICGHYDAYDTANFAAHLKDFSADITGNKEGGYLLTSRGITSATNLIKVLLGSNSVTA